MSSKQRTDIADKVGEIKRMQANWMKERSLMIQEGRGEESSTEHLDPKVRKSREKSARKSAQSNKTETISWATSSGSKKKPSATATANAAKATDRQKSLRTRSASPARNSKHTTSRNNASAISSIRSNSRPSSARSNISDSSRPPSGRTVPPLGRHEQSFRQEGPKSFLQEGQNRGSNIPSEFGGRMNEGVERLGGRGGHQPPRVNSEPNLAEIDNEIGGGGGALHLIGEGDGEGFIGWEQDVADGLQENPQHGIHRTGERIQLSQPAKGRVSKPTLDPDAFDRLADQIASKVRAEMKEEKGDLMNQIGYTSKSILLDDDSQDTDGRIDGHYCSKCKQLMVPPDHAPMMLVPCGHTFCEACSDDRIKCPTCRTRVTSTSLNSALQDVILASSRAPNHTASKVNTNHTPTIGSHHNGMTQRTSTYTPSNYADNGQIHSHHGGGYPQTNSDRCTGTGKDRIENVRTRENLEYTNEAPKPGGASKRRISPEEEARKLEEEYQSLGIRCEALESEETDILERIEIQNREISSNKQQMGNIGQKQQHLREEIRSLEGRLADLEGHRQEYKRQVEDAEDQKREELDQLSVVRTMLRDMQRNREKVKMSARKLDLSLD